MALRAGGESHAARVPVERSLCSRRRVDALTIGSPADAASGGCPQRRALRAPAVVSARRSGAPQERSHRWTLPAGGGGDGLALSRDKRTLGAGPIRRVSLIVEQVMGGITQP